MRSTPEPPRDPDGVEYVGHATTLIRVGGVSVLTDPFLGRGMGPLRRIGPAPDPAIPAGVDVALVSHLHRDHLDLHSLRRLRPEIPLVVPRGGAHLLSRVGPERVCEIDLGETISVAGVEVTAVQALHDGHRDRWGTAVTPLGYVVEAGGRRVYFAGDTDLFPEMSELEGIDLALVPIWGWGPSLGKGLHLDPSGAADAVRRIQPRIAVPIHWGTIYPLGLRRLRPEPLSDPPLEFVRVAAELAPEVTVHVLQPGESMEL
ncbi:MAG: MBL fold metallo-hydrolase [Solirubrobacterales bacterium]|nr:MBL fold metallo-hydrolase [Solirubrobacterales bacterium]